MSADLQRLRVLATEVASFPEAIEPTKFRRTVARDHVNTRINLAAEHVCHVCARTTSQHELKYLHLPEEQTQRETIANVLSARRYYERHRPQKDEHLPSDFVGIEWTTLKSNGVFVPSNCINETKNAQDIGGKDDRWLLYFTDEDAVKKWSDHARQIYPFTLAFLAIGRETSLKSFKTAEDAPRRPKTAPSAPKTPRNFL